MPLSIISSDSPTPLIERLALDLGTFPLGPFGIETILVGSRGTERWIRHELARRHGCAASLAFPFTASFFGALATRILAEGDEVAGAPGTQAPATATTRAENPFGTDILTWRILELLEQGIADEPDCEPLRAFVGPAADRDTRKLLGLAGTVARLFEEYQLYRPDVLAAWEAKEATSEEFSAPERWQRALWRRLSVSKTPTDHIARLYEEAIDLLNAPDAVWPTDFPTRLSMLGVSTLPPVFVRLLHAVARHVRVCVYMQTPSRSTWTELATATNPLFAAFGVVGRELVHLLETSGPVVHEQLDAPAGTAERRTMLATLQADIRAGIERGRGPGQAAPVAIAPDDDSLSVHRCHSPMREMEVLRDQLLAALAGDPTLRPHDILILLPDVATYAPFVEAVFGVPETGLPYMPHHVADRPIAQESRVADAALRLLRLVGARWTAAEVVELLDSPAIRRAAGLPVGATATILHWIEETSIRWGRDGPMRKEIFGLPSIDANSWRAGIDRLLMGYATGRSSDLVDDVLPHAGDTIGDPTTLGAFAAFTERLFDTLSSWRTARPLAEWSLELRRAFTLLLAPEDEDEEVELDVVLGVVDRLGTIEPDVDAPRAFELSVVRDWIEQMLSNDSLSAGFLAGGMTVCAFKPMRVVPHRIVAMVGLDDATFPRRHQRPAFDLIAVDPREGDRDRRADDRQLFLDTLLATGERLILSYVARSARTNVERAASVVVAELLDVVDASFVHPSPGTRARASIEVHHHLQPFSREYFSGDPRLFSYSAVNARALARTASGARTPALPFWSAPLPIVDASITREIRLEDLIACWTNPSRFFCERALGIRLPGESAVLDECEPMSVNKLDEYKVHDVMLRRHLIGQSRPALDRAEAIALGRLPSGALAGVWYDRLQDELSEFLEAIGEQEFEEPRGICVDGTSWSLVGRIDGITGAGRLQVRPATCKPKDMIIAWVTHLALSAAHGPVQTFLIGKDVRWAFGEVADADARLDMLVQGYRAALREPLPFFTQSSHAYAAQTIKIEQAAAAGKGRVLKSPLDAARDAFAGTEFGEFTTGDSKDPYVTLAWRGRDAFESMERFDSLSMDFWRPALEVMTKGDTVPA